MLDKWGRKIDYLRISVTNKCNLRCTYCMPEEYKPDSHIESNLTIEEIYKVAKVASEIGISKIRITGGEPLVRPGVVDLIRDIKALPNIKEVCLTTNGIYIEEQLDDLVEAGLDKVNVSLDTMKEEVYKEITRYGDLSKVMRAIELLLQKGLKVKINAVVIKGCNENEIMDFVHFIEKKPIDLRFIELMPIGQGKKFKSLSTDEIKEIILKERKLISCPNENFRGGPATYFKTESSLGRIGFISAMSHSFCNSCNRIRLTSEGILKQCLYWNNNTDLKTLIRKGISDEELKEVLKESIYNKPEKHSFGANNSKSDQRAMNEIGG